MPLPFMDKVTLIIQVMMTPKNPPGKEKMLTDVGNKAEFGKANDKRGSPLKGLRERKR